MLVCHISTRWHCSHGRRHVAVCGAVLQGSLGAHTEPTPCPYLSSADSLRASKLEHPVQGINCESDFRPATPVCSRAQCFTDHSFEPAYRCPHKCPASVAGALLPAHASMLGNALEMPVAPGRSGLRFLARHGSGSWQDDHVSIRTALADTAVDTRLIVDSLAGEGGEWTWEVTERGLTWEPSPMSLGVSSDAKICPALASTPRCSFRQVQRLWVPCFSISHSPGPGTAADHLVFGGVRPAKGQSPNQRTRP